MSIASHGGMDDQQRAVFQKAQSALLAIPGHARYYQDKMEAMRADVLANSRKSDEEIMKMQDGGLEVANPWAYERFCVEAFRTLSHLPSAECVAVLGFYLNDPVGRDGKTLLGRNRTNPGDDFMPRPINSEGAAMAIRTLGIELPPFKLPVGREREVVNEGEVDAWKDWWNEVKDGKRTYRFIGSSVEYGPDGPVSGETGNRPGERKSPAVAGGDSPVAALTKPVSIVGIVAACTLVAGAVWYFLRGRKAA